MTTKEVAQICGVTDRTVSGNARKAGVVLENGKSHDWTEDEVKRLQLVLRRNALSNNVNASEQVRDDISRVTDINNFKYSKEDICNLCGVSISSFEHFAPQSLTERDFIFLGSSHKKHYNEDVLKKFQLWLVKNQVNQGVQTSVVKDATKTVLELGTLANVALTSGNVEAAEQFSKLLIQATQATAQAKQLEAQNQLLLEQNEQIKKDALTIAGWAEQRSVLAYSIAHHLNWSLSKRKTVGKQLATIARTFNHKVGKVTDRDFGFVNAYGADTWALWESRFKK